MKNLLCYCLVFVLLMATNVAHAALPDGATAPNWTLTDLDGNTHTLYDYLDAGKMVAIDFSATWCPPCWSYHNTGILENLYENYGPNGTDEVMVFFMEPDLSTNTACLYGPSGCVGGTQGNWVSGTPYPIIDVTSNAVPNAYNITYYPTLYAICPDRTIFEAGQTSYNSWLGWIETCQFDGTAVASDVLCAGEGNGSVDLTPTGGYGGISYSWSNGSTTQDINNLETGSYSVTMTEGHGYSIELGPFDVNGPANPLEIITNYELDIDCYGAGTGEIDITPDGGTPNYNYQWNTGQSTSNINNLTPGTYTLTLTDNNNCTDTEFYTITEPPQLILEAYASDENCDNADGEIIAQGQGGSPGYTYDIGFGPQNNGYFPNLVADVYYLVMTDVNGCLQSEQIIISNLPAPYADAGENSSVDCVNTQTTLDGTNSSSGSDITYLWSSSDGNIVSGEETTNPVVDAPGVYELIVTSSLSGCSDFAQVIVSGDITPPDANAGPNNELTCSNASTTLDGSGSTQGSEISYQWSTSDGNIVSGATTTSPVVDANGTYLIVVTNNDNGCTSSATTNVSSNIDLPTANAGPASNIDCTTTQTTLDGSSSSNGTEYSYLWTTTDGNIVSGDSTLAPTVDAAGTYTLVVTNNNNGCTASAGTNVAQNTDAPTADAGASSELNCSVSSLTLDGNNSASGATITYQWTTGDGNIVSGATTTTPLVDQAGTYSLVVSDSGNGCNASSSVIITEDNVSPTANAGTASPLTCSNTSITLDGSGSSSGANFDYLWTTSDGNIISGATSTTPVVDQNGTYILLVTNSDNACTSTASVIVTENTTAPSANAGSGGQLTCTTTDLTLDGSGSTSGSNITYSWSTSNGNIVSGGDSDSPVVDAAGTYTILVTNSDNGCTASANAIVTLNANVPTADAGNNGELNCLQNELSLNGNNSSGGSNIEYQWSTTNGNIVSGATSTTPIVDEAGDYTLVVTNNSNGCTATSAVSVAENLTTPTADAGSTDELNCNNNSITLDGTDSSSGADFTYLWTTSNGNIASGATTTSPTIDEAGDYTLLVTNTSNGCTSTDAVSITAAAALNLELEAQSNVLCNGENSGSATIDANGGNSPYTYSWPGGGDQATENNLPAGNYIATVTDNDGCSQTVDITITEPAALTVNANATHETASGSNDGTASASPAGGASGYSYEWSNGETTATIQDLAPGLYTVIVTDGNNCSSSTTVTINSFDCAVTAGIVGSNVSCFGGNNGTATASLAGGNSPYIYQWSNGGTTSTISNLAAGNYEVTITDNSNCPATALINITQPTAINVTLSSSSPVQCFDETNGSATVSANGGTNNFTYEWSNGDTGASTSNLAAGTYTVTATDDNLCIASLSVTVTQPTLLTVTTSSTDETGVGLNDGTASANPEGGDTPYSYLWNNGETTTTISNLTPGTYTVVITDANGCTSSNFAVVNGISCSLSYILSSVEVTCNGDSDGQAIISNVTGGAEPISYTWSTGATTSSISNLPTGIYEVSISDDNGCEATEQIFISEPTAIQSNISATAPQCFGESTGNIMLVVSGGNAPYSFLWQDGSNQCDLPNIGAGNYSVTVTDNSGCTHINSISVNQPTELLADATSTNTSAANTNDGTATVTPSGGSEPYSILWNTGATTTTINNLAPGTYLVIITDANGCTANSSAVVQGVDCVVNSSISSVDVSCNGSADGQASVSITGGMEPYTYLWSNDGTTATITNLAAGIYSVTASDDLGCAVTEQVVVTEPDIISGTSIVDNVTCNGGSDGNIEVFINGGTEPYTYLWIDGGNNPGIVAGFYSILVTDANDCTFTMDFTVTQPQAIVTTIIDQSNVQCGNDGTGAAMADATGGLSNFTYSWSNGQTGATATGLNAGTYSVIATDANGCTGSSSVVITASDDTPPIAMTQDINISLDATGTALLNPSDINAGSSDNCELADINLNINTLDCSNLGENLVQLIVTDGTGNTSMAEAIVTVADNIAPLITCSSSVVSAACSEPVIYDMPTAFDNCSVGAPELLVGLGSGSIFPVGTSIEVYKVTDESGNTATCSFTVTIEDTEAPNIFCPDNIVIPGCDQQVNYNIPSAIDACSSIGTPVLVQGMGSGAIFPEGTSTETYEVTDGSGNTAMCSFSITITNDMDGNITNLNNACFGESDGTATVEGTGGAVPYSYAWSNGQSGPTANDLAAELYSVIVTDANGCTNEIFVTITDNPEANLTLDLLQNEMGNNADGALAITVDGGTGPFTYEWNGDNSYFSTEEDISALSAGSYSCIITDAAGCITTAGPYVIESIVGINDPSLESTISIFPNPTSGRVQVQFSEPVGENIQLEVFSITGQLLPTSAITRSGVNAYQLDITGNVNGVYLLKIRVEEEVLVKRIILNRVK